MNRVIAGLAGGYNRNSYRANAFGGGMSSTGEVVLHDVVVASNYVQGWIGFGGGAMLSGNTLISRSRFQANHVAGTKLGAYYSSACGPGLGGGICNDGVLTINTTLLAANRANGGTNGYGYTYADNLSGGDGKGGGVCNLGTLDLRNSTLAGNVAMGGDGGPWNGFFPVPPRTGGNGIGGGICSSSGSCIIFNSTLSGNAVAGGKGADGYLYISAGSGGNGIGAGIFSATNVLSATHCTVAKNQSTGGGPGGYPYGDPSWPKPETNGMGFDGGIRLVGENSMALTNSIVSGNSQNEINGGYVGEANLVGVDARLASLANNGGPTPTMALYPDSPAINAAVALTGATNDQRGTVRPVGAGSDIGAYEWNNNSFYTQFQLLGFGASNNVYHVRVVGPPSQTYRLQTSSNFGNWSDVFTDTTDSSGLRPFTDLPPQPGQSSVFYRTVSP